MAHEDPAKIRAVAATRENEALAAVDAVARAGKDPELTGKELAEAERKDRRDNRGSRY